MCGNEANISILEVVKKIVVNRLVGIWRLLLDAAIADGDGLNFSVQVRKLDIKHQIAIQSVVAIVMSQSLDQSLLDAGLPCPIVSDENKDPPGLCFHG